MLLKNTFKIPQNDIFNLSETSDEWERLKTNFQRIVNKIC